MRVFKQLTLTDRIRIEKWLKDGLRVKEIADRLRVDPSTVYRELKRGSYDKLDGKTWKLIPTYSPDIAEQRYQAHLREKGPNLKIGKDHELASYIEQTIIDKDCSPAAVYGYALEEGRTFKTHISVPTIYSYIKKGVFLNLTQKALPRHGVHKGDYKKVKTKDPARAPAGESIEKRPAEVKDREEFGHWEMDTVYSGKKKSTVALLVLTERKTRNENIIVVPDRRAETTVRAINALERKLGAEKFGIIYKSITVDNGSEFALADQLEQSCITGDKRTKVYYCHPYSSWERGSNENVNGMIRRRHPKGTDFSKVTAEEIAATESEFGEQMHLQGEHPIAHFLCFSPEKQSLIWTVNLLNDAARQVVFPVLESAKEIPLHELTLPVSEVCIFPAVSAEELIRSGRSHSETRAKIAFLSPCAFKQSGRYTIFPQETLLLQSLIAHWNAAFPEYALIDSDALQALQQGLHIVDYNLHTTRYLLKETRIPAFQGNVTIEAHLAPPLLELWNALLSFASHGGVGIKTTLGMGGAATDFYKKTPVI